MPKIRLNNRMRGDLHALAERLISCPEEAAILAAAKAVLNECALGAIRKHFPEREMRVLLKYETAAWTSEPKMRRPKSSGYDRMLQLGEPVLLPIRHGETRVVTLDDDHDFWRLLTEHDVARDAHDKARAAILKNYRTLVTDTTTVEDLVAVWPEAAQVLDMPKELPMRLSPEVIDAVKADVARRAQAAPEPLQALEGGAA